LLAGLLALASVLGVGEGHLLHRETRWVGSRYFAKSESLFQSFLRLDVTLTKRACQQPEPNITVLSGCYFFLVAHPEGSVLSFMPS
ncbi:hypothetical protein, partial [Pseudomonas sp. 1239]|uniref:hypothetical protein n=1 Tax=Pseudomonas sp. 1239 TaxID=1985343 RepID=UPI001C49171F